MVCGGQPSRDRAGWTLGTVEDIQHDERRMLCAHVGPHSELLHLRGQALWKISQLLLFDCTPTKQCPQLLPTSPAIKDLSESSQQPHEVRAVNPHSVHMR